MKILDDSGFAYFWTKLKAAFARIVHVHAASDVTLMTGYSKPASGSAISASDSLNAAVGKLEAKVDAYDDSNYVHKTGNESIAGNKTFTGVTYAKGTIVEKPDLTGTDVNKSWLQFQDSAGDAVFIIRTYPNGYGSYADYSFLQTMHKSGSTTVYGGKLILGYDTANSCAFVACTDTSSARTSSSDVITRGYLAGSNSNVVHRTGDESIAGEKTFSTGLSTPTISCAAYSRPDDTSFLSIYGYDYSVDTYKGGRVNIYGSNYRAGTSTGATYGGSVRLIATNSSASCEMLLRANGTATWNGQTIQTSSDERLKTPLSAVPDGVLDAWLDVEWGQFQFLSAVEEKGPSARLHAGLIAQAVVRAFVARGLDACRYGILCHELREAFEDDPGEDLWTVRYAEALCMEAACMRRENARLKKRVSDLEDRLAALELRLGSE